MGLLTSTSSPCHLDAYMWDNSLADASSSLVPLIRLAGNGTHYSAVCSNWLTAAFTVDRYLMICHPFIAKRWCTLRLSKVVIVAVWVASFCYTLPRFYEYVYFTPLPHSMAEDSRLLLPSHWYRLSALGDSNSFRFGYHLWAWCVLVIGLPSLLIAILNIFLVREINRSIERMRYEQGVKMRRHETDIMLIGVIVIFFVCQIPSSVSHVMWGIRSYRHDESVPWLILNEVGNLFVILNASINIIPYYLFGRRFRTLFLVIYFGRMKSCVGMRRSMAPLSHQPIPPTPIGRSRLPSRPNTQPTLPSTPSLSPPSPPPPPLGETGSCPLIIANLDGKNSAFV